MVIFNDENGKPVAILDDDGKFRFIDDIREKEEREKINKLIAEREKEKTDG